ncbi:hypothetical protein RB653_010217 [Dictyostelium firmibasis]|uniref:G-protein coupled receptors family 3 profile domain-containing protein n=1 Tax=Dictyostelium firmibasis TaxID=79012 RepID=A0AAN7TSI3_9MYCE
MKSLLFIIIIIFYFIYITIAKECKIAVLLSGSPNDLGYNYLMNEARVKAESELKLDFSIYYENLEDSMEEAEKAFIDSIEKGSNLIVVGSFVHVGLGLKYAEKTKDQDIYWIIRGNKRPSPDLPHVVILNFNSFELHYLLGYFSGLMTKTGVVGFVAPGPDVNTISTDNSFYLGAKKARPDITFLNVYVQSWYNPTVSYSAAKMLIENGADLIGMSQDDMSCQKAMMDNGLIGIGATGYPTHLLFGSDVGVSYITNWTNLFVQYAQHVLNDDWPDYSSYFTNLSREDSIFIDSYSYKVPINIQDLVNKEIQRLKNTSYIPYRSDPFLAQLGIPYDKNGLLVEDQFRSNKKLLKGDNISKVIDFGQYSIPIDFVDYPNSLRFGVAIVSGVCIFICFICMILVVIFKKARVIKSSSPAFLLLILLGCCIIFAACILFAQSPTDQTCSGRIWLLSLGYTLFLGNLLVKNWRIWLLFDNPKLKKRAITNWKLYPWVFGILAIDVMILGIWQGLGDIIAEPRVGYDSLTQYQFKKVCSSNDQGSIALYLLLVFHGLILLVACFISFKIKVVDIEEFNESKPITTSVYIITFCLFIVIPLMVSPQSVTSQTTIICVCAIVTTLISMLLLFGSKFYIMATQGLAINETFATSTKSSSKSSKSSYGKEIPNPNVINFGEDDTSDETSEEKHKSPKQKSITFSNKSNSHLAVFTSDEETSKTSKLSFDFEKSSKDISIDQSQTEQNQTQRPEIMNENSIRNENNTNELVNNNNNNNNNNNYNNNNNNNNNNSTNNISDIKAKRLSNQQNGETEIDNNNI